MIKLILSLLFVLSYYFVYSQSCEEVKQKYSSSSFSRSFFKNTLSLHSNYDQKFIHINIEANDSNRYINCTVKYILQAKENLQSLYFEFAPTFTIDSIFIDDQLCNYYFNNDTLILYTPNTYQTGQYINVSISYHGESTMGGPYRGLTNTFSPEYNQSITWTLSESFHLKDWLPCKQDLADRFDSAWIFITVDSTCKAGSEGILTAITPLPNGKVRYEWKERHPIVYYLLSIAVGKYFEYSYYFTIPGYNDSILFMNYIYQDPAYFINNKANIDRTIDFIRIFSDKFGLYPFADEKYGHCLVPLGGGMEHQTMTTIGNFNHYLVAHELAHMWFGNNITCATWQDIWINEGFASYAEYIALQYYFDQHTADLTMAGFHARARKEPEGSIYIPIEEAWDESRIFNGNLSYKKGAALIHMIRYLCNNDSIFFTGLKQLQSIYNDSILTGNDVKNLYESLTGIDFDPLFNQYYYGKGYPIYNIIWWQDSSNHQYQNLYIKINQRGSSSDNNLFTIPLPFRLFSGNQWWDIIVHPSQNTEIFEIQTNHLKIDSVQYDPQNWILDSLESIQIAIEPINISNVYYSIYPNPANDVFYIYSNKNLPTSIKLIDIKQHVLYKKEAYQFPISINIPQHISAGVYILKIENTQKVETSKIVIIR